MNQMTNEEADKRWPEHARMKEVQEDSHKLGEFLEWLLTRYELAHWEQIEEFDEERLFPVYPNIQGLLAEYFDIDLKKIEAEKDDMLEMIRG